MSQGEVIWRPTATREVMVRRAHLLAAIRHFFAEREVLEVETPVLSLAGTTDPQIQSLTGWVDVEGSRQRFFLQTSPEFAMKRLLASGSGPIFQIARVFRAGERGRLHNPEFTMLEWYRPGFDQYALMDEIDALLATILGSPVSRRTTYVEAFQRYLGIDPLDVSDAKLQELAQTAGFETGGQLDRDQFLDFLLSHFVAPKLGQEGPEFLMNFPASQAALARLSTIDARVSERFELFMHGIELANGFNELTDAGEQARRFAAERVQRRDKDLDDVPADQRLVAALAHGLPPCSGVAVGLDRLLMILTSCRHIDEVLAFPVEHA